MSPKRIWEYLKTFFKETRQELKHVNWPTRREAMYLTSVVIGISVVLAIFLGVFDYIFLVVMRGLVL